MAVGTPAAPEIGFLGEAIEQDFTGLPVSYQGVSAGGARVCHLLLASYEPSGISRSLRLKVCVYASGISQQEVLELHGLLVRWHGIGLNPEQVGIWNMGHLGADRWLAVYSLDILAEEIYPSAFDPPIVMPAQTLVTDVSVNGVEGA